MWAGRDLGLWLVNLLTDQSTFNGDRVVLKAWCEPWEKRIEDVATYQDQMVIRSLFLRSLEMLKNLNLSRHPLMTAFMLVEMAGSEYRNLAQLDAFTNATDRLARLVCDHALGRSLHDIVRKIFARRALFLCDFTSKSTTGPMYSGSRSFTHM